MQIYYRVSIAFYEINKILRARRLLKAIYHKSMETENLLSVSFVKEKNLSFLVTIYLW